MNSTRTLLVTLAASGLLVGAAAATGLLSAGSAAAAGGSPAAASPAPTPSPGAPGRNGQRGGPGHGGLGGRGGSGGLRGLGQGPVLHGEFVTGGQNGSTRTVVVQTGTVTVKGGSTITVKSTDGYTVQWTLDEATRVRTGWSNGAVKDIAQGDTVRVEGTKSGSTTTAQLVAERPKGAGTMPRPKGAPTTPGSGSSAVPSPGGA